MTSTRTEPFDGAKIALLCGDAVVSLLRDDIPTIPFPGMWDFPGGGREGNERPEETALREVHEEVGLLLPEARICYRRMIEPAEPHHPLVWFLGMEITPEEASGIVLGGEGQAVRLRPVHEFMADPLGIIHLKQRLREFLAFRAV